MEPTIADPARRRTRPPKQQKVVGPALPPCPGGTLPHRVPELRDQTGLKSFNLGGLTVSSRLQPCPMLAPLLP